MRLHSQKDQSELPSGQGITEPNGNQSAVSNRTGQTHVSFDDSNRIADTRGHDIALMWPMKAGYQSSSPEAEPRTLDDHVDNYDKDQHDMLSGLLLEDAIVHNAMHKMQNPIDKMFFLGFIAGIWVGFGGIAGTMLAGGIPIEVRQQWPTLPKLGLAVVFPFALHFILLFGGELFTGNCMILTIGLWNRTIPIYRVLINLLIVWIGNFLGCLTCAVLFSYETELFSQEPYLSFVRDLAYTKAKGHSWINIFLRAIPANTLVCMAVVLGFAARDSAGKIMALWFPVVMFVIPGFEHAVANMFFISNGLLYGSPITIGWLFFNQSAAVLGNFIGGAIVMGTSEHAMNHWSSPIPFERGHAAGSLAAGDVESTRKAKEVRSAREKQDMKNLVFRPRSRTMSGLEDNHLQHPTLHHTTTIP